MTNEQTAVLLGVIQGQLVDALAETKTYLVPTEERSVLGKVKVYRELEPVEDVAASIQEMINTLMRVDT